MWMGWHVLSRNMNTITEFEKFERVKATGELPSPKGAALAIIRLLQREDSSLADVARVVKTDPAFAGRIIKAANSVHAGVRRPITSIQEALAVLGIPAVRSLALGFSLLSNYSHGKCHGFNYQRFWSHSLACAVAMQALTHHTRVVPVDEAFSIGLLARIGELALATLYPDEFARILQKLEADRQSTLVDLEHQAFIMTHGELSAAMLLDWGLPKVFSEPVRFHDDPQQVNFAEGSRQQTLLNSLALAEHIADICLAPDSERRAMLSRLFMLGSRLSLDAECLTAICDKAAVEWLEWSVLLQVDASHIPPFEDISNHVPAPSIVIGAECDKTRMRILVVGCEASMFASLQQLLQRAGHDVFFAATGQQGLEMAIDLCPHIMLIEWSSGEMGGLELTRSLRQTKSGSGIYILLLTSLDDEDHLVQAFESGVDDYMTKPVRPRVLEARLRAGQRLVRLQLEVERDSEDIRRFAAELALSNRRLQEMALTDPLTGFPNRRYAMDRMQQEWSGSSRNKRSFAVMVVDVDAFKRINDTYGHDIGDMVLSKVANALKAGLRSQDVVCRMGGDEFLVISPDTTLEAAIAGAERVRMAVHALAINAGGVMIQGSISIGVAVRDAEMADVDALIKRADQGVYVAKQRGRNCSVAVQLLEDESED